MANNTVNPAITDKYHIEVPVNEYSSGYCVYRVRFGSKYYINKGKTLMQSAQNMANYIERGIRLDNAQPDDMFYKIITYVKKNRVIKGKVEVISGANISEFELLKMEQEELNKCKDDPNCLNNSPDAYIPKWINEVDVQKFLQWKGITEQEMTDRRQSKKKEHPFSIVYFNKEDKEKRGVYKLVFGNKYYIGRAKLIYNRMTVHRREILKRLLGYKEILENDAYIKIMKEIMSKKLKVATCHLVKECVSVADLVAEEQKALDAARDDKNCLNFGFVSTLRNEKDDTVDDSRKRALVRVTKDGKRIFYTRKRPTK